MKITFRDINCMDNMYIINNDILPLVKDIDPDELIMDSSKRITFVKSYFGTSPVNLLSIKNISNTITSGISIMNRCENGFIEVQFLKVIIGGINFDISFLLKFNGEIFVTF